MFRVKICGITRVEDALAAEGFGASAIGLNFFAPSPRSVDVELAAKISSAVSDEVKKVGVFVNAATEHIRAVHERVGLDCIQLHGDEPVEMIDELAPLRVVRAVRCKDNGFEIANQLVELRASGIGNLDGLLFDAHVPGLYGGTGQVVDWASLRTWSTSQPDANVILAGGLNADNIYDAIHAVNPAAVDTASGVESEPGIKCHELLEKFITQSLCAFDELDAKS